MSEVFLNAFMSNDALKHRQAARPKPRNCNVNHFCLLS